MNNINDRKAELRRQPGCRQVIVSPVGSLVSIFDAKQEGINQTDTRWAVYCEDHVTMYEAKTLADARDLAPTLVWCDECQSNLWAAKEAK